MDQYPVKKKHVALLRGINVGGHHKVPMAELREVFEKMGHAQVKTLLNSGNIVFEAKSTNLESLQKEISTQLENTFGFPIPVSVRKGDDIQKILTHEPFKGIEIHKDLRFYVTFIKSLPEESASSKWISPDNSFRIIEVGEGAVYSILDVSRFKTPDAMKVLEKRYSKDITTRNWNTVVKIGDML